MGFYSRNGKSHKKSISSGHTTGPSFRRPVTDLYRRWHAFAFKLGILSHSGRSNGVPFLRRLHFYYHHYVVIQGFEITHAIFRVQFG